VRALRSLPFALKAALSRRPSLSAQRGSLLIEVMVGSVVLGIATLAVLSGLEGAQGTGVKNRARTEYANLAQQDIERLRAMPIASIANLDQTRTVTVGDIDYTVHSQTDWIVEAPNGAASCTDYDPLAEYLKVWSTVSSPGNINTPVTETTLLTPAPGSFGDTGTATVRVTNRDGVEQNGVTVALSGPGSYTAVTNQLGCAVFRFITAGSYTAQVSGGVSWSSQLPATAPVTVNAGRTTFNPIEVDTPASLRAFFVNPSGTALNWSRISVAHAKLPAGFKVFPNDTSTTMVSSIDATNLFPHKDAYGVYAGSCIKNNPTQWKSDYFQPGVNGYVVLNPGDSTVGVNVTVPVLTLAVTKRSSAPQIRVFVKQADGPECTEEYSVIMNTTATGPTNVAVPVPFGRYKVCVDDGHTSSPRRKASSSGSSSSHYNSPPTVDESSTSLTAHRMMPPSSTSSKNGALAQTDAVNLDSNSNGSLCPPSGW
jgi:type II secretory pathway pseudopilin PulG